jgi:hypothetical protein
MADEKDLDPSGFVQRIRQLGEQQDQHDAERVKKLEEDLIQGRSERLARRAGGFSCAPFPLPIPVPVVVPAPAPRPFFLLLFSPLLFSPLLSSLFTTRPRLALA